MNPNSDNSKSAKNVNDAVISQGAISQSVKNEQANNAQVRISHYAARFTAYDDEKLLETVEHERKVRGWGSERSYYLAALRAECEKRQLSYCW